MGWLLRFPTPSDEGSAELAGSIAWDLGATGLFDAADGTTVVGFDTEDEARSAWTRLTGIDGIDGSSHRIEPATDLADHSTESTPVVVRYRSASGPDEFSLVTAGAFGHGGHPTTALALDLLVDAELPGAAVLDVGTGTGVLAIAAARAGAGPVIAVDNDPAAVASAEANVAALGLGADDGGTGSIKVTVRPVAELVTSSDPFDLVVVNVLLPVHRLLGPDLIQAVAPGGRLITSGHLTSQEVEVGRCYPGLTTLDRRESGDWSATLLG